MKLLLTTPRYYYQWKEFRDTIFTIISGSFVLVSIESVILNTMKDHPHFSTSFLLGCYLLLSLISFYIISKDLELKKEFGLSKPRKPLRIKKRIKLHLKIHKRDYIERMVLIVIGLGIFLPIRLLYYNYVSHFFGFNLGILTIISIAIFILVKYKKLGWVGDAFARQTIKFTSKKYTKWLFLFGIGTVLYYGFQLWAITYVETADLSQYQIMMITLELGDKTFSNSNSFAHVMGFANPYNLSIAMIEEPPVISKYFNDNVESTLFITLCYAFFGINYFSGNWFSHYNALMFAEEIEGFLLFFFDKKMYRNGMTKGTSWKDLGMFEKTGKLIVK